MINHAVILSAGLGTRFLPYTKAVPKPMLPIIDTPTLEYIIKEALECNIKNIIVVVGHNADVIKKHFSKNDYLDYSKITQDLNEKLCFSDNVKIEFVTQHILNGTASAILSAQESLKNNDFLVMNADELFIKHHEYEKCPSKQLIEVFNNSGCNVIGAQRVSKADASKLGVIVGKTLDEKTTQLIKIIEKPNIVDIKDPLVNLGRYVVKNNIFEYLKNVKANKNGEFALTDALVDCAKHEQVLCYDFIGKRYDIGNKLSYMQAFFDISMKDKQFGKDFQDYVFNYVNKINKL